MKKIIILIIGLSFLFSGCSTSWLVKKAKKRCPECFKQDTTINSITTKKDTIIHLDTLISIILPRDTVTIDTTINKLKPYSFKRIHAKNGIINVDVWMNKGTLHVSSFLDSAMLYQFNDSIRIKNAIITNLKETVINQEIIIEDEKSSKIRFKELFQYSKYIIAFLLLIFLIGLIIKYIKWVKKK